MGSGSNPSPVPEYMPKRFNYWNRTKARVFPLLVCRTIGKQQDPLGIENKGTRTNLKRGLIEGGGLGCTY